MYKNQVAVNKNHADRIQRMMGYIANKFFDRNTLPHEQKWMDLLNNLWEKELTGTDDERRREMFAFINRLKELTDRGVVKRMNHWTFDEQFGDWKREQKADEIKRVDESKCTQDAYHQTTDPMPMVKKMHPDGTRDILVPCPYCEKDGYREVWNKLLETTDGVDQNEINLKTFLEPVKEKLKEQNETPLAVVRAEMKEQAKGYFYPPLIPGTIGELDHASADRSLEGWKANRRIELELMRDERN